MRADGFRHLLILAARQRVVAAHHALQFGEFADHAGGEVRLRQPRGAGREARIGTDHGCDVPRQPLQPRDALALRAELRVEHHLIQLRQEVFQLLLAVLVPEEARIGQPRAQHAFIARDQRGAAIGGGDVGHHAEAGRGAAIRRHHREVALVHAHRRPHQLGRQVHEGVVDPPQQRHRPFDQARHFVDQPAIRHHGHAMARGQRGEAVLDHPRPFRGVEDDAAFPQASLIAREGRDFEGAGRHHAMAFGQRAAGQPMRRIVPGAEIEAHDLPIQQAQDALQRPDPGEAAGAPAHGFRPGEAADHPLHGARGEVPRRDALARLVEHPEAAAFHQRIPRRAVLLQEAGECRIGRADARAAFFLAFGRNLRAQRRDQSDAARAVEGPHRAVQHRGEGGGDGLGEVFRAARLHARGDFLGEEFEQEFGHQAVSPATQASQQRFARARTRPI